MGNKRFSVLVSIVLAGAVTLDVAGQLNESALVGVTTANARVYVSWDDRITSITESQFTDQVRQRFELGLLRAGVKLDADAPNFLNCELTLVAPSDVGVVGIARTIQFQEMVGPELAWVITWEHLWVAIVGKNNLEGESYGESCAEAFEADWLRANN